MLAYTVHDVRVIPEKRELPPQDGWACFEPAGVSRLACSCGYTDGPTITPLAILMAKMHIHGFT